MSMMIKQRTTEGARKSVPQIVHFWSGASRDGLSKDLSSLASSFTAHCDVRRLRISLLSVEEPLRTNIWVAGTRKGWLPRRGRKWANVVGDFS